MAHKFLLQIGMCDKMMITHKNCWWIDPWSEFFGDGFLIRVFWRWIPSITNVPPQTNGIQKDDLTLDPMCDFSYSVVPFSVMFIPVLYFFLHISFKEFLVPRVRVLVSISHHHCNHHQTKKDSAHCQTNRLLALFLFLSLVVCIGFCRRFWWCVSFPVDWARSC